MSNRFLLASVLDQGLSLANVKHPLDPPLFLTTHPHLHHLLLLPKDSLRCQPPAHRRQPTTMQQHTIVYSPVPHIDHLSLSLRLHKRIHPPLHSWRRNRKRAHRLDSAARLRWRLNNESRVRAAQDVLVDDHVGYWSARCVFKLWLDNGGVCVCRTSFICTSGPLLRSGSYRKAVRAD